MKEEATLKEIDEAEEMDRRIDEFKDHIKDIPLGQLSRFLRALQEPVKGEKEVPAVIVEQIKVAEARVKKLEEEAKTEV